MLGLIFVTALRAMGQSAIMYFLPLYLLAGEDLINPSQGGLGKDTLTVGFYLAGAQVTGIFAQPLMGWISDKYGRKIVLIPAMALLGFLFIALNYVSDGYQLILNVLAMGAFVYSLHTIFIAAAMDVSKGRAQSTVVSLIYGASFLGTVSPIIAGLIVDEFGLKSAFIYSGVVALSATIVLGFIKLPSNEGRQKSPH